MLLFASLPAFGLFLGRCFGSFFIIDQ